MLGTPVPLSCSKFFVFMQFLVNNLRNNRLAQPPWELAPPENLRFANDVGKVELGILIPRGMDAIKGFPSLFLPEADAVHDNVTEE